MNDLAKSCTIRGLTEIVKSRGGKEVNQVTTFVINYRRTTGEVECTEFADFTEALKLRHKLESEISEPDVEIVSLTAESLEILKQTHRRYFLNEILLGLSDVRGGDLSSP